jgi:hypothetical protein
MASALPFRAISCALLLAVPLVACSASVRGSVKTGANAEAEEPDPFAHLNDPEPSVATEAKAPELSELDARLRGGKPTLALLGARHDLQLQARVTPSCSCMAFASGLPTDRRFLWEEEPPALAGTASTVVAFGMVEGECASEVVASYRGYELDGADVRILLEPAVEGRPRLSGAVVPSPQPGGRFVIVPPKDAPFGKSRVTGETQCVLTEGRAAAGSAARTDKRSAVGTDASKGVRGQEGEHLHRAEITPVEPPEDVPTSEEFDSTPSDVPLDDGQRSLRDGFHLGMILGAEYPIMRVSVGNGLEPGTLSALGGGFDLFVGGNQKPGMAVGFTIGGASAPSPSFDVGVGQSSMSQELAEQSGWDSDGSALVLHGTQLNIFRIGAFVDYYFSDDSNWHGLLTLGYASVAFSGAAITDTPQGFAMQGGIGYDFWLSHHWSLGLLGRLMWAPMSAESLDDMVHVFSPNLGLSATFH